MLQCADIITRQSLIKTDFVKEVSLIIAIQFLDQLSNISKITAASNK